VCTFGAALALMAAVKPLLVKSAQAKLPRHLPTQ
jgi:hypothetical protein